MTKIEIIDAMAYREFRDKRNIYYELRELVEGIDSLLAKHSIFEPKYGIFTSPDFRLTPFCLINAGDKPTNEALAKLRKGEMLRFFSTKGRFIVVENDLRLSLSREEFYSLESLLKID